ncbi:MAG: hypothetical protein E6J63_21445 [Deltaproteobacteria bacterium]|nr:MAG: hypothetical protein E6J63_21445 [Deltaproteobacteria bacterium]
MRTRSMLAPRIALGCFAGAVMYANASHAAPIGWIDGGYWANGQFNVSGWACDPGSTRSVWVSLTDPRTGQAMASVLANAWSEPAVAAACRAPGATYLRFNIPLAAAREESVVGQPIQVRATSNFYPWTIMPIGNSGTFRYPDNTVRGYVDNASYDGSQVVLVGWACAGGIAQSVNVHVYVGGPAGSGSWFTAGTANQPSEPAVAGACGVGYGAYRFSIAAPFGPEVMMQLGGLKIYVHGISPVGGSNRLLTNSGLFALPGQRATVSGTCGYVPALWNAPYGSVVLSRSNGGPIRPVIVAIGEYYTHSMLSLGTSGIVHAEMQTPAQSGWPTVCTRPLDGDQLQYGYPGVEQINLGGAYADLQGEEITPVYQWGDPGTTSAVASSIAGAPQITVQSKSDGAIWLPRKLRNGAPISYSLYQYRNIEQTNELASNSVNNGMVCSTFLSWAHLQGGAGYVPAYTYDHALIANAANALFNTVQNACNSGVGFWGGLLRSVSCPFNNVCENAGDQVTNCMAANACGTNDNAVWHGVRDDPYATATSISPDRIAGLAPHGVGTTVWSYDQGYHPIAWNAPGPQYGCWY